MTDARTNETRSVEYQLGKSLKIWEDKLRNTRTARLQPTHDPTFDAEARDRWVELYEWEVARCKSEGPTHAECQRIRARLLVWSLLRRALPTRTPPDDPTFDLYCATQKRLDEQRVGGERVPLADLERASRFGRTLYFKWLNPIQDQMNDILRLCDMLEMFGTSDDAPELQRLRDRGDTIYRWLHEKQQSGIVPWLPTFAGQGRPLDEWWREKFDRKIHRNVCAWWEAVRKKTAIDPMEVI